MEIEYDSGFYPETITTDRLKLTRVCPESLAPDSFLGVMRTEGVHEAFETYPYEPPETLDEAKEYLQQRYHDNQRGETVMYFIRRLDGDDPFIGMFGVKHKDDSTAEIGFWISADHWGRGYCPEAADAILHLLLVEKDFDRVEAQTRSTNENAKRAIEKILVESGGERIGTKETTLSEITAYSDSDEPVTEVAYALTAEQYGTHS